MPFVIRTASTCGYCRWIILVLGFQRSVHANSLSFKLLHFILMVNVIGRVRGRFLKYIFAALLSRSDSGKTEKTENATAD